MSANPSVPIDELRHLVHDLFTAAGVPEEAASDVAEALVRADQEGQPSHGVMMVDLYLNRIAGGSVSTRTSGEVVTDRAATAVIDAHHALGQVTAKQAISLACDKAETYGVGIVTVRNAFHFGTASRYTELAAERGMVGIAMANTRPLMPAPGGSERLVGNNPIGFALPTSAGQPLSFDMATSQAAMGKIRLAHAQGSSIPVDWATDSHGVPTSDPGEAIAGMLLPSGGAKGFGLALVIDLLAGLLSGGGHGDAVTPLFGDATVPYNSSQLFIAIDPAFFTSSEEFDSGAADAAERVRSSAPSWSSTSTRRRTPTGARTQQCDGPRRCSDALQTPRGSRATRRVAAPPRHLSDAHHHLTPLGCNRLGGQHAAPPERTCTANGKTRDRQREASDATRRLLPRHHD